ncbi:uncharacterized protein [Branchiostoma lanceolatum]|uniref:uncharacterized protein n=1 Tax=Branchiostoma lanceolatum TaxID=7740 RepID=UPI003456F863
MAQKRSRPLLSLLACVDPPTQANTTGPVCDCPYLLGESCTYPCYPGYHVISGDVITRTCTANGSWTESDLFCQDIDECLFGIGCSQTCINSVGSYSCSCIEGFVLGGDGHGCYERTTLPASTSTTTTTKPTTTTAQPTTTPTTSPAQPSSWFPTQQQTSTARLTETSTMSTTDVMPTSSTTTVKTTTRYNFEDVDLESSDYLDDEASSTSPMTTLPTLPPSTAESTPPPPVVITTQESSTQTPFLIEVILQILISDF